MHVKAIGTVVLEEKLLEVLLQLRLRDCRQHSNIVFLSVEVVLVSCKLLSPILHEFLLHVLVFLRDGRIDSADISRKLFISHGGKLYAHLHHKDIKASSNMQAILG